MNNKLVLSEYEEKIIRLLFLDEIMKIESDSQEKSKVTKSPIDLYKEIYKGLDGKGTMVLKNIHKELIFKLLDNKISTFDNLNNELDSNYEPIILEAVYTKYDALRNKIEATLA